MDAFPAESAAEGACDPALKSITIVRHGKPALDRSVRMNARRFITWWDEYDAGGLAEAGQKISDQLKAEGEHVAVIIASTLRRARETADVIANGREIRFDELFVEARLPPPMLPDFFCVKPGFWGVLARISWWFGFHGDQESRVEAEIRAEKGARKLIELAEANGSVMLVAHGWFNRMMRPVLLAHGWECVDDHGDTHWSYRRYEKRA